MLFSRHIPLFYRFFYFSPWPSDCSVSRHWIRQIEVFVLNLNDSFCWFRVFACLPNEASLLARAASVSFHWKRPQLYDALKKLRKARWQTWQMKTKYIQMLLKPVCMPDKHLIGFIFLTDEPYLHSECEWKDLTLRQWERISNTHGMNHVRYIRYTEQKLFTLYYDVVPDRLICSLNEFSFCNS